MAFGRYSHAEGYNTKAGWASHAEGCDSIAIPGRDAPSHAEGYNTEALQGSHAEGWYTVAKGLNSHAEGNWTVAASDYQHVQGNSNKIDSAGKYAFIIGNGTDPSSRSNAFAVDWDGNIYVNNASTGVNVATLASDLASLQTQIQTLTDRVTALENA